MTSQRIPGPGAALHTYHWQLTENLDSFLAPAGAFLQGEPALHSLLLTVTDQLRVRGPRVYGAGTPHFGVWGDAVGHVRGAFVRTPPLPVLLSPLPEAPGGPASAVSAPAAHASAAYASDGSASDAPTLAASASIAPVADAVSALAERLAPLVPDLAGVSAQAPTAARFAAAWQRRTGVAATVGEHQRLYQFGTLIPPRPAPSGRARIATEADRELLIRWYAAFEQDLGAQSGSDHETWADSRIAYGGVTLWETPDGTPVAMAGATRAIAGQVRVAPVYTPPELRGRGYASAVTAALSRRVRDAGAAQVLLFTDLANPTSNGIYQRIGYRPVSDFDIYAFAPFSAAG